LIDDVIVGNLRKDVFLTGYHGGMAHLASCFSCMEILYSLYCKGVLRIDPNNAKWDDRDRLILSKGHAGLALYAVLMERGLISRDRFHSYLQAESGIGGEPCTRDCEWIETATGSLGHGLSVGVGMAMALKYDRRNARVFVVLGDGECEEGTVWEAAMSAAAFHLDNLVAILDYNRIQKMDFVSRIIGAEQWRDRLSAFGWQVEEVDGHDVEQLTVVLARKNRTEAPRFVIAHTVKGKGVSIMENNPVWHFKLPNRKELKTFQAELEINSSEME